MLAASCWPPLIYVECGECAPGGALFETTVFRTVCGLSDDTVISESDALAQSDIQLLEIELIRELTLVGHQPVLLNMNQLFHFVGWSLRNRQLHGLYMY